MTVKKKAAPTKKAHPLDRGITLSAPPPAVTAPIPEAPMTNQIHDDDAPATNAAEKVTVKALKYHTHAGEEHQEGDVYEVDATQVDNLMANGMAAPVEK